MAHPDDATYRVSVVHPDGTVRGMHFESLGAAYLTYSLQEVYAYRGMFKKRNGQWLMVRQSTRNEI